MSEINLILQSIKAAKAANEAALHALTAVEKLLTPPQPEKKVEKLFDGDCQHENAVPVASLTGEFLVCECGEQLGA